jgi:DNA-binding transcriptional LysR family regulator
MVIELRLIRHALALGQHRNFARAAEALNLSQPSLSRSIAALEQAFGVPLFDRSHKGVVPTAFGRVLLERGEAVLKGEADLRREIQLLAGIEEGVLAVGAGPYASEISVALAVARVVNAHPRLKIQVLTNGPTEVVRDVFAERIDVGVVDVTGLGNDTRLVVEPLPEHRVYLACRTGHPLTKESSLSLSRVLEFPLVTSLLRGTAAATASSRDTAARADAQDTGDFAPQILVNSLALARLIARSSDALFPGTAGLIAEDVGAGHLVRLDFDVPAMRTKYGLIYLRNRTLAPAARVFIDALRGVEREAEARDVAFGSGGDAASRRPKRARARR